MNCLQILPLSTALRPYQDKGLFVVRLQPGGKVVQAPLYISRPDHGEGPPGCKVVGTQVSGGLCKIKYIPVHASDRPLFPSRVDSFDFMHTCDMHAKKVEINFNVKQKKIEPMFFTKINFKICNVYLLLIKIFFLYLYPNNSNSTLFL